MVIELGDNDLVTRLQATADGPCHMKGDRRHIGAERNLSRITVEEVCERAPSIGDDGIGLGTRGVLPMRVRVVMQQVLLHRLDDRHRHLRSSRTVEVRDGMPVVYPVECREVSADIVGRAHVCGGHDCSLNGTARLCRR